MSIWLLTDSCTVDDNSREHCIIKNEQPIPIRNQAWTLLLALIEAKQNQEILTYASLSKKLWPNSDDLIIDKYVRDTMRKIRDCIESILGKKTIKVVRNKGFHLTNDIKEISKLSTDLPHVLTYHVAPHTDEQQILHRNIEINEIISMLESGQKAIAISGFGGIGKTSIAHILYGKLSMAYDFVAWVNYSENLKSSILSSFSIFSEILDEHQRWLSITRFMKNDTAKKLIFIDNVDYSNEQNPMTDTWLQEIPNWTGCSVILTTRMEEVFGYQQFFLDSMNEKDSIDLFYFYYSPKNYKTLSNNERNNPIVKQIVQHAGCHTYVVELLARGASRSESIEFFYNKLVTLGFQIPTLKFYTEYSRLNEDISGQLKLLFDVSHKTETERKILFSLSIFPNISLSFSELFDWLGYNESDIDHLINEGWLILRQGIYMHPLVKEIIRLDYINSKCPIDVAKKMQTLLLNKSFVNDSDSLSNIIRKIDIASFCIAYIPFNKKKDEMYIYYNIATHLGNLGKVSVAVRFYRKSLQIAEELYKNQNIDDLTMANIEIDLGYQLSYTRSGRAEAITRLSNVLKHLRNLPTNVNANKTIATVCDYLGYLYSNDNYSKAENLLTEAFNLRKCNEAASDADKHLFAWTEDNLGFLLNSAKVDDSIILLNDSLKIREELEIKYPGKYYSEVAWTMNNLGITFLCGNHDPSTATKYFKSACNILKPYYDNCHGLNSADYALQLNNLAIAMLSESYKNSNCAVDILEKSIEINRELNSNHEHMYSYEMALTLMNWAFCKILDTNANVQEAEEALSEAKALMSNQDVHSLLGKQILGDIAYLTGLLDLITNNSLCSQKSFDEAAELWSFIYIDTSRANIIKNVIGFFANYAKEITLTDKLREAILSLWIKYVQSGSRWVSLINKQNPFDFSKIKNDPNVYVNEKLGNKK